MAESSEHSDCARVKVPRHDSPYDRGEVWSVHWEVDI